MRRLIVSVCAVALMGVTSAADAANRKPSVIAKAPAPTESKPSFYAGVHAGYGWGRVGSAAAAGSIDTEGFLAGVQLGINYQSGRFVYGVEGDVTLASMLGNNSGAIGAVPFAGHARHLWFSSLAGRAGYSYQRSLFYAKAGAALTGYNWQVSTPAATVSNSNVRLGWLLGAGVEHALMGGISVKAEYNYMDFGSSTETASSTVVPAGVPTSVRVSAHLVKLGLNYRFTAMP